MKDLDDNRPNPEDLLKSAKKETARGKLKLFLGAAPGVGKTYAMLTEAREKRKEGLDVLVGWVDTHGRKDTEALLDGLDVLPRKSVIVNGHTYYMLDVDAIIKRRPATVVIDEMPHSNPPGSLHKKRWQDIEEILDVGINVYSALNIQHLDSLNGVVARVTGVEVTETVPDSIFDNADEVRLVDLPPDDLLMRLEAGKIYLPEVVERARNNYFKKSNLIALRELTLRSMANRVDSEIKLNRRANSRQVVDDTTFGLLLVLEHLTTQDAIREAARLARALATPWYCVWVDEKGKLDSTDDKTEVSELLEFARSLGAGIDVLVGDYAQCVRDFARTHNLSIVATIPASHWHISHRRRVLRETAPELNILTLSFEVKKATIWTRIKNIFGHKSVNSKGIWQAIVGNLLIAAAVMPLYDVVHQTNLVMFFLLFILFCSVRYGMIAATLSSFLSVICFDFTVVHPSGSFAVADLEYLITFGSMLVIGITTARLVAHRKEMGEEASRRERQTRMLYDAARSLSPAIDFQSVYKIIGRIFLKGMAIQSEFWSLDEDNEPVREQTILKNVDEAIVCWCLDHKKYAGQGTHTLNQSPYLYMPLLGSEKPQGVVVLKLADPQQWTDPTSHRLIKALVTLTSQTLERLESVEDARKTIISMESERLRHSLIQSLSHDLRTPLTSLMANAENLLNKIKRKEYDTSEQEAQALVDSSQRMIRLMSNLLEMARLQSSEIVLKKEWIPASELIGMSKNNLKDRLDKFNVFVEIDEDCPMFYGDPVLLDRVLTNLLDNATKYCPEGSIIIIGAKRRGDKVTLSVSDNGPGIPTNNPQRLFDPFKRGQKESKVVGVGLGLAICKTIARVHDADLLVMPSRLGGASFMIALPIVKQPELDDETEILSKLEGGADVEDIDIKDGSELKEKVQEKETIREKLEERLEEETKKQELAKVRNNQEQEEKTILKEK